jgi:hypothetical protein
MCWRRRSSAARRPSAGASKLAATTAESPANCARLQRPKPARVYVPGVRQERSAQADITLSQPRIHSPRLRKRLKPPQRRRKATQTARGFNRRTGRARACTPPERSTAPPVREGGLRVVVAANSFARAGGKSRKLRGFNGIHPDTRKPRVERGFVASSKRRCGSAAAGALAAAVVAAVAATAAVVTAAVGLAVVHRSREFEGRSADGRQQ